MFQNIGFSEILLIGVVALLLFGPKKLPEIGKMLGKTLNEFKKGARELMEEVKTEAPPRQAPSELGQKPLTAAQTHEQAETRAVSQEKEMEPAASEDASNDAGDNDRKPQEAPARNAARRLPD